MVVKNGLDFLPDWYRTEKEAFKTIEALSSIKELSFYAENPDPFIRRLAIIRIGSLLCKDSFNMLNNIVDDNLETRENRELAALFMQKLNEEMNLGYFFSPSGMPQFSGSEDLDSRLKVSITDPLPSINLDFRNTLIESQLSFDNEFLKCNLDEKEIILPFSMKDWLKRFLPLIFSDILKKLKEFALVIFKTLFISYPKKIIIFLKSAFKPSPGNSSTMKSKKEKKRKPEVIKHPKRTRVYHRPVSSAIKGFFRFIGYVLLFPFRFLFRFKFIILGTLVAMYCLMSFTVSGKSFLFRINPRAYYWNMGFLDSAKRTIHDFIEDHDTISRLFNLTVIADGSDEPEIVKTYNKLVVTAPKGLYLRREPKSTGSKLVLMEMNTIVEYMEEEYRNEDKTLWYKVRFNEETVGWANAGYLKEAKHD